MLSIVLKTLRIANDYKTKDVAERAGCTPAYICSLEAGKRGLSLTSIKKLAVALNVTAGTIVLFDEIQEKYNLDYKQTLFMILGYYIHGQEQFLNFVSNTFDTKSTSSLKK